MGDISLIFLNSSEMIEIGKEYSVSYTARNGIIKSLDSDSEKVNLSGRRLVSNETDDWRSNPCAPSDFTKKVKSYISKAPNNAEVMLLFYKKSDGKYIESVLVRCYGPVEND